MAQPSGVGFRNVLWKEGVKVKKSSSSSGC